MRRPIAFAAVTAAVLAAVVTTATPASAHTEVSAKNARALAENVTLEFHAESESADAAITKLEVVLPDGITFADITYKDGPKGWKLTATDDGYAVSGPDLAIGEEAGYTVTVRQLPDAESLVFKTLQTYSDGHIDRWIELEEESADGGHGNPAPRLDLAPAAGGATPISSSSPTAEPTTAAPATTTPNASAESSAPATAATAAEEADGMPLVLPVVLAALALVLAGGLWWWKRRSASGRA